MKKSNMKGFTLVELLAVIVILAIILVIAVPKVMNVIEDAKKATLESTAKMIASQAEKQKVQNTVLGKTDEITCESVAKINDKDYEDCDIAFDNNTAKVTITGSGKFEGLFVCNGTKTESTATTEECDAIGGGNGGNNIIQVGEFATDSWETIIAAVQQAETNGTEYPYEVGDEKTIDLGTTLGTHTVRIANKTKCNALQTVPVSKTACGFVLEFKDIITEHSMNGIDKATSTSVGGWPVSEMRVYVNNDIYNTLPEELKSGIIDTYVISSKGSETITGYENVVNGNFYSTDKLYLLSPEEVYGTSFTNEYDSSRGTSRQLDYYATYQGDGYIGVSTTNYAGAMKYIGSTSSTWWLRSAYSGSRINFFGVNSDGYWSLYNSYYGSGVALAFRLAD